MHACCAATARRRSDDVAGEAAGGQGGPELRKLMFSISTMEELGEVLSSRDHFRENLQTALLSLMGSVPVARGALLLRDRAQRRTGPGGDARHGGPAGAARRAAGGAGPGAAAPPPSPERERAGPGPHALDAPDDACCGKWGRSCSRPCASRSELVGIVVLGLKYTGEVYNPGDLELIMVMANFIALGVHNQELFRHLETANTALRRKVSENRRLYRNLESIYSDTVRALGAAIDAKDPYTRGHSDRVARIAVAIGRALGLPEREISALRIASHLHDIGKIAVDNSILLKVGRLDQEEMVQIHRHPMVSYDILSNIAFPYPDVALIARHHHEWVDGSGYPDRLGPKELLPGMKIICLGRLLRRDDVGPPLPSRAQARRRPWAGSARACASSSTPG